MNGIEFEKKLRQVLYDYSPKAMKNWIAYANELETKGIASSSEFLKSVYFDFNHMTRYYKGDIVVKAFNLTETCQINDFEIYGVIEYFEDGLDATEIAKLLADGKCGYLGIKQVTQMQDLRKFKGEPTKAIDRKTLEKSFINKQEFLKLMGDLLPDYSTKTMENWINYAESDRLMLGTYAITSAPEIYTTIYAEFDLITHKYGSDIALKLFNLAENAFGVNHTQLHEIARDLKKESDIDGFLKRPNDTCGERERESIVALWKFKEKIYKNNFEKPPILESLKKAEQDVKAATNEEIPKPEKGTVEH